MARASRRSASWLLLLVTLVLAEQPRATEAELDEAFLEFLGLLSLAPEGLEDPMDLEALFLDAEPETGVAPAAALPAAVDDEKGDDHAL
ncbi:MAG: hypothetical protein AAGI15_05300 [Pseudomonadota bacterium]